MREWLSGGVSPCQGEGRGFESRLALLFFVRRYVYLRIFLFGQINFFYTSLCPDFLAYV